MKASHQLSPRPSSERGPVPSTDPEVCVHQGLYTTSVSPTLLEIPLGEGPERHFEASEYISRPPLPARIPMEDEQLPSRRKKKPWVLGVIAAVVIFTIVLDLDLACDGSIYTAEGEAYHGYWQQNLYSLNSQFGSIEDLQALSTALHARDMYLMVDVVVNHVGWAGNETIDFQKFLPFNDERYFHTQCPITQSDYLSNQTAVEKCWLGDE
ncbi:MAG: hypothetical protein Q9170_006019 [Blastenia crenularia]